ncbi:MAG: hypothetical protein ABL958_02365 [Bdellovibrionia bacterium]
MRTYIRLFFGVVALLLIFQNCSQPSFSEKPATSTDTNTPGEPEPDVRIIEGPYEKTLICGGGRQLGKYTVIGNGCTMPATTDESCDRWGCAVMVNSQGDSDCPSGTDKVITDRTPVYFLCLRRVITDGPVAEVCGGTRIVGKYELAGECTDPVTSDQSCNRWGCAEMYDSSTGDSRCPADSTRARISDDLTYIICIR